MEYLSGYSFVVCFVSVFSLCNSYHHLLISLLSLEFLGLSVLVSSIYFFFFFLSFGLFSLFYMVILVIESILGLSLLAGFVYCQGNDMMDNKSVGLC